MAEASPAASAMQVFQIAHVLHNVKLQLLRNNPADCIAVKVLLGGEIPVSTQIASIAARYLFDHWDFSITRSN